MEKVPKNGWIELAPQSHGRQNERVKLNDSIPSVSLVQYKCDEYHHNFGVEENFCFNKQWKYEVPNCERFCLLSYAVPEDEMDGLICTRKSTKIACTDRLQIGTHLITINELNESIKKVCNSRGQWNVLSNLV